ncbi:MAG: hypothetical protein CVU97_00285 [Firmicutes bacterium HGW-Firmicutes-21]|nr:MAG: hypothetical protein CVU97_00285 [Firmicutes bacterium HGW-Firmicutes-21]
MEFFYIPFEYLMKLCLFISGNYYVFALFFFALIMQIVLLPLGIKQHKSQIMQRKMRPKEMAIRKKYAGRKDRATQQKMNLEVQEMYRTEGYNQLAGCLPMLIQLPIILILFAIVRAPISYSSTGDLKAQLQNDELYRYAIEVVEQYKDKDLIENNYNETEYDSFNKELDAISKDLGANDSRKIELVLTKIISEDYEYFQEIAKKHNITLASAEKYTLHFSDEQRDALPKFGFFGETLLDTPNLGDIMSFRFRFIHLIPLLVFITSYFGGVINRKYMGSPMGADGNPMGGGKFMEWGMPILSLVFSFSFPAAVGIYWIWRTVTGAVQPIVLNQFYPMPVITEADITAAEKDIKQSQKKKKKVIMIEVDEDDESYKDLEVDGRPTAGKPKSGAAKSSSGGKKPLIRNKIEMLSADDDDDDDGNDISDDDESGND